MLITEHAIHTGLAPVADAFAGTVQGKCINMKNFQEYLGIILKGVGTTGVSTIQVVKATDVDGANAEAVEFYYRRVSAVGAAGSWTKATTSGFSTTAGSSENYEVAVSGQMEGPAEGDKTYIGVKATETVDSAVLGGILNLAFNGRYGSKGSVA